MTVSLRPWGAAVALSLSLAAPVSAQNDRQPSVERGTELDALVAAGSTEIHTGPAVAAIAGWRLSGWARAEARAAWLARGSGADAFEADLGATFNVIRGPRLSPYVGAGFGLYRASFDSAAAPMSTFYAQRLTRSVPASQQQVFTDPVFRASAGIDWRLTGRIALRPEASALFVRRDGRGETIGLIGLRVGFRFEDHPVTP